MADRDGSPVAPQLSELTQREHAHVDGAVQASGLDHLLQTGRGGHVGCEPLVSSPLAPPRPDTHRLRVGCDGRHPREEARRQAARLGLHGRVEPAAVPAIACVLAATLRPSGRACWWCRAAAGALESDADLGHASAGMHCSSPERRVEASRKGRPAQVAEDDEHPQSHADVHREGERDGRACGEASPAQHALERGEAELASDDVDARNTSILSARAAAHPRLPSCRFLRCSRLREGSSSEAGERPKRGARRGTQLDRPLPPLRAIKLDRRPVGQLPNTPDAGRSRSR